MTTRWIAFTADLLDRRDRGTCHRCGRRSIITRVRGHGLLCSECVCDVRALKAASK